jgi:DEAD/DEAH box helicase domain-containing protein
MDVVFASGRRSLESLRIAYATTDRINTPAATVVIQEAADGAIRLLGARRRLTTHGTAGQPNPPRYVTQYLAEIAQRHRITPASFVNDVVNYLNSAGVLIQHVLAAQNLCLMRPGQSYFECPQCRRIHLHPSGTVCTECQSTLGPPQPIGGAHVSPDYYSYLAMQAGPLFRLNCEELTGQTSRPRQPI